jgi:hypothetical protein
LSISHSFGTQFPCEWKCQGNAVTYLSLNRWNSPDVSALEQSHLPETIF